MSFTRNNIPILLLALFSLVLPFWKGADGNYGAIWESASILSTIGYAVIIYTFGFFGGKFTNLHDRYKGVIAIIIAIIIYLSWPFVANIFNLFYEASETGVIYKRTSIMFQLVGISFLFLVIDIIMLKKSNTEKINYTINIRYSDFPVLVGLIVLCGYAYYLGDQTIETNKLNHFFEGAIAFQMIFSNIIWMYNDDEFWKSNTQTIS